MRRLNFSLHNRWRLGGARGEWVSHQLYRLCSEMSYAVFLPIFIIYVSYEMNILRLLK
jgi:hypothetical protein